MVPRENTGLEEEMEAHGSFRQRPKIEPAEGG